MHFKKSIQSRYWVSLMVFLIPVVVFGIFVYIYNIDSNKKFISQTRLSSFNQATSQLGYIFDHLKTMAVDVSANQDRFISHGGSTVDENAIINKLSSMEKNAAIDVEALFYIRGEKYIYSSSQKNLYSYFEQQYISYDISRSKLFTKLNSSLAPTIYQFYFYDKSIDTEGMISFIYPLDPIEGYPASYIVFLIQENILKEKFNDYLGDSKGDLYVYNNRLEIVLSPTIDKKSPAFAEILKTKGIGQIYLPKSGDIALRQIINGSELTVVTVMPENEFYKQLIPSQRILIILIFLLVLCCLILAVLGVRRTYQPIKNLVKDIVDQKSFEDNTVNEIDMIKNTFNKSKERNQSLMQQLANQNTIIANQFVLRLINGKFKNMEDFNYNASCIGFTPNKEYWVSMHLTFFNKSTGRQTLDKVLEISKDFNMIDTTILFTEQIHQPVICYVLHFDCAASNLSDFCNASVEQFQQFLLMNNVQDFMISVGSPCNDPLTVKHSSFEAGAAVQLAIPKSGQIYFYQKTENLDHENYMIPCMEKSLLIEGIRHGDIETSLTALGSIIGYIERSGYSFFLVRLLCSELLNTLINLAKENNILLEQNELKDIVIFSEISDFQNSAITITKSLCRKIHAQLDLNRTLQKQDVLSFITENFTREDFSLDFIADSLNLTKSKISTILKEDVGCGFPQYISILRMNEIKRQLIESNKPIQDIIRDAGYLDVPNFIRKFKMVEGVTPGQFRTLYGKK